MIETTILKYFREIASAGSLRHAAERLFIAPSALSRHVIALEHELGVALFERRARGMQITDAGRLLLGYANDSQERFEALRADIHQFEVLQRGKVDIACVEGLLSSVMPAFVESFLAAHEGISLTVAAMGSRAVADAVAEHRVDLGIVFGQPPRHDLLELARMSQPLCAIVSPEHPLARRHKCRLVDVAAYPVVLPDRSFGIRQMIDRVRATSRLDLRIAVETNSLAFAWKLVLATEFVTFLPLDSVRGEVAERRLVAVPLDDPLSRSTRVTLVGSASRTLSVAAESAIGALKMLMGAESSRSRKRAVRARNSARRSAS
jgi:DNA-binding transcriptional LysR family regulator